MYIAALDLGGTKTIAAVCDEKGTVLARRKFPTNVSSMDEHFDKCVEMLRECFADLKIDVENIAGLGITLPGMADGEGNLIYAPFSGWRNVPVCRIFSEKLGIKVVKAENDVNACAIAETYFCGYKNHLWITVSTGIGGAVVIDGKLCRGASSVAGELGHVKVEYSDNARRCPCGQYGCAEAHASGTAIGKYMLEEAQKNKDFAALTNGVYDAKTCFDFGRCGDAVALSIIDKAGDYLGRAVASALNVLNPECVIIGGGVALSLDMLLPSIRRRINKDAVASVQQTPVLMTKLGYDAGLLGAASLIIVEN